MGFSSKVEYYISFILFSSRQIQGYLAYVHSMTRKYLSSRIRGLGLIFRKRLLLGSVWINSQLFQQEGIFSRLAKSFVPLLCLQTQWLGCSRLKLGFSREFLLKKITRKTENHIFGSGTWVSVPRLSITSASYCSHQDKSRDTLLTYIA